jgi:hypothetical protein
MGSYFFVYRELPIDENNLPKKTLVPTFFISYPRNIRTSKAVVQNKRITRNLRTEHFCLSVSPDKQKLISVSSVSLW